MADGALVECVTKRKNTTPRQRGRLKGVKRLRALPAVCEWTANCAIAQGNSLLAVKRQGHRVMSDARRMSPSSSGPGHWPFTPGTAVQIRSGTPYSDEL